MTRKDFQLIADVLNGLIEDGTLNYNDAIAVACRFEEALAGTNERFDRQRFYQAATESLKRQDREYVRRLTDARDSIND